MPLFLRAHDAPTTRSGWSLARFPEMANPNLTGDSHSRWPITPRATRLPCSHVMLRQLQQSKCLVSCGGGGNDFARGPQMAIGPGIVAPFPPLLLVGLLLAKLSLRSDNTRARSRLSAGLLQVRGHISRDVGRIRITSPKRRTHDFIPFPGKGHNLLAGAGLGRTTLSFHTTVLGLPTVRCAVRQKGLTF
jgi:hypothetical protein